MAQVLGGPIAVTTTAASLSSLLGLANTHFSGLVLRAADGNTATVWIGKSNLTAATNQHGYLDAREALSVGEEYLTTSELYLISASGTQTVYVLLMVR